MRTISSTRKGDFGAIVGKLPTLRQGVARQAEARSTSLWRDHGQIAHPADRVVAESRGEPRPTDGAQSRTLRSSQASRSPSITCTSASLIPGSDRAWPAIGTIFSSHLSQPFASDQAECGGQIMS